MRDNVLPSTIADVLSHGHGLAAPFRGDGGHGFPGSPTTHELAWASRLLFEEQFGDQTWVPRSPGSRFRSGQAG
jgi:hypothetical protein